MDKRSKVLGQIRELGRSKIFSQKKLWIALIVLIAAYGTYRIPAVYNRVNAQWVELSTRASYFLNPPDEAVFLPQEQFQIALVVQATLAAMTQEVGPSPTAIIIPDQVAAIPTITPTPFPQKVILEDIEYIDQHNRWNYCGPANLTMALKYWGWNGTRDQIAEVIKPGEADPDLDFIQQGYSDKNVMPYELTKFVRDNTYFNAILRVGGEIDLLKKLIANGYPVVIEKGYYALSSVRNRIEWMGHYLFVTGYDEGIGAFIVQDAYLEPGNNLESDYESFEEGWQSFNYIFFVVYPLENETEVLELLGPWANENWANQHALDLADQTIAENSEKMVEFFSWFNKGTSHVALDQYQDAAYAYDYAFLLYSQLEPDDTIRPFRIMWYQVGPYWAYYYTQRYTDLINLADTTLNETISRPTLEESLYWRGMAYLSVGRYQDAVADFKETVYLNSNYAPGISILEQLGENLDD